MYCRIEFFCSVMYAIETINPHITKYEKSNVESLFLSVHQSYTREYEHYGKCLTPSEDAKSKTNAHDTRYDWLNVVVHCHNGRA